MPFLQQFSNLIPFAVLTIAPVCAITLLNIIGVCVQRKRAVTWLSLLFGGLACLFVLLHEQGGVQFSLAYALCLFLVATFLSPVFWVRDRGVEGVKVETDTSYEKGKLFEPSALSVLPLESNSIEQNEPPMPAINGQKKVNVGIQLQHAVQVLKRLQSMKLTAGDRLETDVIQKMLGVYQTKGALTAEETRSLNNYLATLLKLMSKYSL